METWGSCIIGFRGIEALNCCHCSAVSFICCSCKETDMALKQVIRDNYDLLHRSLNPSSKLFIKLRSVAAINHRLSSIKLLPNLNEKNTALLDALIDVPDGLEEEVMNGFIAALRSTDQDHVANIFRRESDEVPMSDEHYKLLTDKRRNLCQFIKPNDGLADHLVVSGVLSDSDRTTIISKPHIDDMAEELLNILLQKSDTAFQQFLNALNESDQSHVAYLLTSDGLQPMSDQQTADILLARSQNSTENVPTEHAHQSSIGPPALKRTLSDGNIEVKEVKKCLKMERKDTTFTDLVRDNFVLLLRCLDLSIELVIELLSVVSLSNRLSVIDEQETVDDKTNAFLTALLKIPDEFQELVMDSFVVALRNSGQDHVANIFRRESDKVPMSDEHCEIFAKQRHQLCQFLDPENGLLDKLVSTGVIIMVIE